MGFQILGTVIDDDALHLAGVSDLEIIEAEGRRFLIIAAEADSAISSFEIIGNTTLVFQSEVLPGPNAGTDAVADIEIMNLSAGPFVVSAGRWDDNSGVYGFSASTGLSLAQSQSDTGGNFASMLVSEFLQTGGSGFLYSSKQGTSGLKVFSVDDTSGSLSFLQDVADTPALKIGDVVDITSASFQGSTFLFTASAFDAGVQVFEVDMQGGLTPKVQSRASDGLGYQYPSVLATADVEGSAFLLMGATGSDSITVFRVGSDGTLAPTDQVFDTLVTRFGGITTLETVVVNGVTYVLAAGGDDGLTLFHLSKTGSLNLIDVLADDFSTTLENVSDAEVFVQGNNLHVLAGSSAEHGVTHLSIDLPYETATVMSSGRPEIPPAATETSIFPIVGSADFGADDFLF